MDEIDKKRKNILSLLKKRDLRLAEVAAALDIHERIISEDLRILREAGKVWMYRDGKTMRYTLMPREDSIERYNVRSPIANKRAIDHEKMMAQTREMVFECIKRGTDTAYDIYHELEGMPGVQHISSINGHIRHLLEMHRIKRGEVRKVSRNIERNTYEPMPYLSTDALKDELSASAMLMMGINPYPHKPGKPVEVKSQSSGGITYKPPQSYGVADYGAFA